MMVGGWRDGCEGKCRGTVVLTYRREEEKVLRGAKTYLLTSATLPSPGLQGIPEREWSDFGQWASVGHVFVPEHSFRPRSESRN
jgi:hypothetical protein